MRRLSSRGVIRPVGWDWVGGEAIVVVVDAGVGGTKDEEDSGLVTKPPSLSSVIIDDDWDSGG